MKGQLSRDGNRLIHEHGGETLIVEAWGRDGLRVRATPRAPLCGGVGAEVRSIFPVG